MNSPRLIIHQRPAAITDIDIQAGESIRCAVREVVLPLVRELRRRRTDLGITSLPRHFVATRI